ncbi:uncharacterized protein NMK_2459 [Novimethylophilus kurashikiensis]|uniref:Uncharacterized protein n=1 Tax=Novimethylophilus kurashikiensis TaxID=1825523 RepID=A0A2R5FBE0_9PROT|nr:hypothetical protein [Novimethylophilus kurashikiensis]GBG14858.1 uncharacterized protein NMK_2459 [Novimethylophilus kurashikiensis]
MRFKISITAQFPSLAGSAPFPLGTAIVTAENVEAAKAKALAELSTDEFVDGKASPDFTIIEMPRFLISENWNHFFEKLGQRIVRFVYDHETECVEHLDILGGDEWTQVWHPATEIQRQDFQDSLVNANEGCLVNPQDYTCEESNSCPSWATRVSANLIYPKVAVLCSNSNGEPELYTCSPAVTKESYDEGLHYSIAKSNAEDEGYEGPYLAFDDKDQAAKQLVSTADWMGTREKASEASEVASERQWNAVCSDQGWNDATQIIHLIGFIRGKGLFSEFAAYAEKAADEENEESILDM